MAGAGTSGAQFGRNGLWVADRRPAGRKVGDVRTPSGFRFPAPPPPHRRRASRRHNQHNTLLDPQEPSNRSL